MQVKYNLITITILFVLVGLIASCSSVSQTDGIPGPAPVIDLLRDTATATSFMPALTPAPLPIASSLLPTNNLPVATNVTTTPLQTPDPTPQYTLFEETEFNKTSAGKLANFAYVCDAGIDSAFPGLEFSSAKNNPEDYCTIAPADSFLSDDKSATFAQIQTIHKIEIDAQINDVKNPHGPDPSIGFLYQCDKKDDSPTHEFWMASDGAYLFNETDQHNLWRWGAQDENLERILTVDFDAKTFTLTASGDKQNSLVLTNIFTCDVPQRLNFGIYYKNDAAIDAVIKRISIYATVKSHSN